MKKVLLQIRHLKLETDWRLLILKMTRNYKVIPDFHQRLNLSHMECLLYSRGSHNHFRPCSTMYQNYTTSHYCSGPAPRWMNFFFIASKSLNNTNIRLLFQKIKKIINQTTNKNCSITQMLHLQLALTVAVISLLSEL